jgi:hypothetical protein
MLTLSHHFLLCLYIFKNTVAFFFVRFFHGSLSSSIIIWLQNGNCVILFITERTYTLEFIFCTVSSCLPDTQPWLTVWKCNGRERMYVLHVLLFFAFISILH